MKNTLIIHQPADPYEDDRPTINPATRQIRDEIDNLMSPESIQSPSDVLKYMGQQVKDAMSRLKPVSMK